MPSCRLPVSVAERFRQPATGHRPPAIKHERRPPTAPSRTDDRRGVRDWFSEPILKLIAEVGFEHPTPIQAADPARPPARDIIALAQTGSGKTAAFVIPLAEKLKHAAESAPHRVADHRSRCRRRLHRVFRKKRTASRARA
jgi:superfamily II DNA/RNA helicase